MKTRLLVYGLLRKGDSLGHMMAGAESLGEARVAGHDLYDLGDYPGAVPGDGELVCELYVLPNPTSLAALDEAEGVGRNPPLYRRVPVMANGRLAWLYVYARSVEGLPKIESGDWFDR